LTLEGVTKSFGAFKALDGISLDIADGELLAVLGPSGCGKTSLLRAIAGFDEVSEGRIAIGDQEVSSTRRHVPPEDRRIGLVFQTYALWPHMTVADNVAYPLKVAKIAAADRDKRVAEALALVGLTGFDARSPAELSGGQRQRVALARCLVMTPAVVLLDEPLANLDLHLRAAMEAEFAEFHRRTRTTMIYITHDQAEAMALADRIAVMDAGRILQIASPSALFREPSSETVARFIGKGMVLSATVGPAKSDGHCSVEVGNVRFKARAAVGQAASPRGRICLRSRDLALAAPGVTALQARVARTTYQGGYFRIEVQCAHEPAEKLWLDVTEPCALSRGDIVGIAIRDAWVIPSA
jgi:iron(III) transport system ATP-binding protein